MDIIFELDDTLEIEQPIGWDSLELSLKRDDTYHGMTFEASLSALGFTGVAAQYIKDKKTQLGVMANIVFSARMNCVDDPYATYIEIFRGRLNMGKYKASCGATCVVTLPVEEQSCRVTFRSRFDQDVDMDATQTFNRITGAPVYTGINMPIDIPAKALQVGTVGSVQLGSDAVNRVFQFGVWVVRPTYERQQDASIATSQLIPGINEQLDVDEFSLPISPQLLFEDKIDCFEGEFPYEFRNAGVINIQGPAFLAIKSQVIQWDGEGNIFDDGIVIEETIIDAGTEHPENPILIDFDITHSGTMAIADGIGVYSYIRITLLDATLTDHNCNVTFNPNTSMDITVRKLCPTTNSEVSLIHETLSKIAECMTNRCIRVKSEYYGRTDSQPFSFATDGCGSLRALTSGLKLREAAEDRDTFFLSMKTALEGLNAIDNIGFDIVEDPDIPGKFLLRIEQADYFYQDAEVMALDYVLDGDEEIKEEMHYSLINVGYGKWEVEGVNGLGEPNSSRVYRTGLETINNTLNIVSSFVAGSYAIEVTRQQSFAESGKADTGYDNETFIFCLNRNAYGFEVEQDNITNDANIFDPATLLNYRITPVRNLMRWFKSIINSYPSISNSSLYKLFFSSGTGNFQAAGEVSDDGCRMESGVVTENQDLFYNQFADVADATPIWKNEFITLPGPLSFEQYLEIKSNPYRYISYQCGTADYQKGWIQEIKFKVAAGSATFILKKKW